MGSPHFILPACRGAQFKKGFFALRKMAETIIKAVKNGNPTRSRDVQINDLIGDFMGV